MPEKGYFELYADAVPPLPAGTYVLAADHDLTAAPLNNGPGDLAVDGTDFTLKIISPRYTIPPNQVLATFPPASAVGDWRQRLPQIVFKRRTLPWERDADTVLPHLTTDVHHRPPYLALVVLAEGEGTMSGDVDIAQCVTPGTPMADDADTSRGRYLEVRQSIVDKIFPTVTDLQMMAHVRKVNLEDTELALGDDDGYLAVIVSNRLPQPGPRGDDGKPTSQKYTAYLLNVEGQLHNLPASEQSESDLVFVAHMPELQVAELFAPAPNETLDVITMKGRAVRQSAVAAAPVMGAAQQVAVERATSKGMELAARGFATGPAAGHAAISADDNAATKRWIGGESLATNAELGHVIFLEPTYRFPVLTSWDFVCTSEGTFESLMDALDTGMLGTEDPHLEPALRPEIADTGHIVLDHRTRRGEAAEAWYRGPLVPQPTERTKPGPDGKLPLAHTGDQLRRVVPDGHEDLSQASAFEIGRLLALSRPGVVAALAAWRKELFGAARVQQLGAAYMDSIVAGFSAAAVAEAGVLDDLIARRVIGQYAGGILKTMPAMTSHPVARVPAFVESTKPEQVLVGLGLDPGAVKEAVARDGLAAFAGFDVVTAEVSNKPLSTDTPVLSVLQASLSDHIDAVAEQVIGQTRVGQRRRKDALDRLLDAAQAARTQQQQEGES